MSGKHFKRIIATLVATLTIGASLPVWAAEVNNEDCFEVREDGTRVTAAYRVIDGVAYPLTKEQYLETKGLKEGEESTIPVANNSGRTATGGLPVQFYKEKGHISYYEKPELTTRISPFLENRTSEPSVLTFACSYTQGMEVTGSLTAKDQDTVEATIGVAVNHSASYEMSIQQTVKPMTKAWIECTPAFYNTYGNMQYGVTTDVYPYYTITSEKYVSIFYPRTLNGVLDGTYVTCEQRIF